MYAFLIWKKFDQNLLKNLIKKKKKKKKKKKVYYSILY